MFTEQMIYGLAGIALFSLGLRMAFSPVALLRRVLAINVAGAGLFLLLIAVAYRGTRLLPDPVPQALVLTGIVVAFSATALALALGRRLRELSDDDDSLVWVIALPLAGEPCCASLPSAGKHHWRGRRASTVTAAACTVVGRHAGTRQLCHRRLVTGTGYRAAGGRPERLVSAHDRARGAGGQYLCHGLFQATEQRAAITGHCGCCC